MKYFALTPDNHKTTKPLKPIKIEVPKSGWLTTNRIGNYRSSIGSIGSSSINIGTNRIGNYSSTYGSLGSNSFNLSTNRYGNSSTSIGFILLFKIVQNRCP